MSALPRRIPPCILGVASIVAAATGSVAAAADVRTTGNWVVTITDLGELVPGGGSQAYGINEAGEIVGTAINASGQQVRPIWRNGAVIGFLDGARGVPYTWNSGRHAVGATIVNSKIACHVYWIPGASGPLPPLPGGSSCATSAFDVNVAGEMAGRAEGFDGVIRQTRPVTWLNGRIHRDLGMPPGARRAVASGINDLGHVVGHVTDAITGRIDAFVHRDRRYEKLQPLSDRFATYAIDINNRGDIVGTSDGGIAVVWKAGQGAPTVLPIPAGRYPHSVWHINDNGDVVGAVTALPPKSYSAVLWRNGEFMDLGHLAGGLESYGRGINNAGQVVGASTKDPPYTWRAVLWTVAPRAGSRPPRR